MVVNSWGWGEERGMRVTANGMESFEGMIKNVLKLDNADYCML